jgi:hypothetical protein
VTLDDVKDCVTLNPELNSTKHGREKETTGQKEKNASAASPRGRGEPILIAAFHP